MTKMDKPTAFSRRTVLLASGALVVSVGAPIAFDTVLSVESAYAQGAKPPLTPDQLSSYIAINADGSASAFFGKMDMGHGLHVAIGQMVAEELDVPFKAVTVYMGDTATSVNQGGASGSTGIQFGGKQMRMAAAEARRVLVEMASAKLGTPDKPHPLQTAYIEEQVPQCGYCINGWIMTAAAFLANKKKPSDAEIKGALEGIKCRCGTHVSILKAVKRAATMMG